MNIDTHRIISFANLLISPSSMASAKRVAEEKNWINANGMPTRSGIELVRALQEQHNTRSVFRSFS